VCTKRRAKSIYRLNDDDRQLLSQLGLTSQQAKVYLALSSLKQAPVKVISKLAEIDRSEVYRAIEGLEKFGLIEKIITTPIEYRPVNLETSIPLLIQHKKQELGTMEHKAAELLQRSKNRTPLNLDGDILLFSPRTESVMGRINDLFMRTEKSIDIISTSDRFLSRERSQSKFKAHKGVKTRLLVEKPTKEVKRRKKPEEEFRMTSEKVAAPMAIHDNKEAMVFISETTDFAEAAMFYTNNPRLVRIFSVYFDSLWKIAQENYS
jgi:sugar-specific transcriptional regulator TrmB